MRLILANIAKVKRTVTTRDLPVFQKLLEHQSPGVKTGLANYCHNTGRFAE